MYVDLKQEDTIWHEDLRVTHIFVSRENGANLKLQENHEWRILPPTMEYLPFYSFSRSEIGLV